MPRQPRSPGLGDLSQSDYDVIQSELIRQDRVRQMIQKALSAGMPCAEQDEACQANIAQLQKIKNVYFPDKP